MSAYARVRRVTHAVTSAGEAVQTPEQRAWNLLNLRGYTRTKFWSIQNLFRAPTAGKLFPACGHELFTTAFRFIHLLLAFDRVCFAGPIISTRYRRDQFVKRSVTGPIRSVPVRG